MAKFIWNNGEVPRELKITQVYGLIFTKDGRMLLKVENKNHRKVFSLAGGTPEQFDDNMEETLRRELIEEVNTTIHNPIIVGYQKVDEENGTPPYAQVRMTAIIDEIGEVRPDPDNGEIYERLLTTPEKAIKLLNWGSVGESQIKEALKIAVEQFGLKLTNESEEYV